MAKKVPRWFRSQTRKYNMTMQHSTSEVLSKQAIFFFNFEAED